MNLNRRTFLLSIAIVIFVLVLSRLELIPARTSHRINIADDLALRLRSFGIPFSPTSLQATHAINSLHGHYRLASASKESRVPDTTAVILNWTRLQNVILISAVLCGPWLDDTISEVFVWNNNPNVMLTPESFKAAGCSPEKLRIYNSPVNALFQARYLACAEARAPYCFTQDDDYLVQPEVIKNLHAYFLEKPDTCSIHLLPAHEHLLSRLRTFTSKDSSIATTFAWLGYGTYLTRSSARDFLDLLRMLNATSDEMKMADNYFTILANGLKSDELWFDHGVELGGGQPFTIGNEGDVRNDRHIARALEFLSLLTAERHPASDYPYVSTSETGSPAPIDIASCRVYSCIVKSNIPILPSSSHDKMQGIDTASVTRRRLHNLDAAEREEYIHYPLSNLVDARRDTAFRSPTAAKAGEWIILDALGVLETSNRVLELSILTEKDKASVFMQNCAFSSSVEGTRWTPMEDTLNCVEIDGDDVPLAECSIRSGKDARFFRLSVAGQNTRHERWTLHELWLRYVE